MATFQLGMRLFTSGPSPSLQACLRPPARQVPLVPHTLHILATLLSPNQALNFPLLKSYTHLFPLPFYFPQDHTGFFTVFSPPPCAFLSMELELDEYVLKEGIFYSLRPISKFFFLPELGIPDVT